MYVIYKLVPIERCLNHPDWTFDNGRKYGKFVVGAVEDERIAKNRVSTLQTGEKHNKYYYSKE